MSQYKSFTELLAPKNKGVSSKKLEELGFRSTFPLILPAGFPVSPGRFEMPCE